MYLKLFIYIFTSSTVVFAIMIITSIILLFLYGSVQSKNKSTIFDELHTSRLNFFKDLELGNVTFDCRTSIEKILKVFESDDAGLKTEVIKFIDASSKLPNGILAGNIQDLGNFDECMNIHLKLDTDEIYGKYCSRISTLMVPGANPIIPLQLAYCVPHTCTSDDVTALIPIVGVTGVCQSKLDTHDFDAPDIAAIALFSFFLFLVVVSTALDAFYQYFEREIPNKLLIAFSIWTNGKKIFNISSNSEQLSCLNGIKALSMGWVILGHSVTAVNVDNNLDLAAATTDLKNMYLVGATVSVDTFFLVGGLLVMYVFLKATDKGIKLNIPMFYLHRYLRLTPALAILVLFNATLLRYFEYGPLASPSGEILQPCKKYWWSTLLYIQNLINSNEYCMGQTWYLSVDMQLYILTPLVLISMQDRPKVGLYSLIGLSTLGVLIPFSVTYSRNLPASNIGAPLDKLMDYAIYYYYQTHTRFGSYVIGMIAGYLIFTAQKNPNYVLNKIKTNKIIIIILWLTAIAGILACTYGGYDILTGRTIDKLPRSLYNGINRNAWAVAVSIVIILCCLNCGGPINEFLSAPVFQFFSKLSYSMYLVHISWMNIRVLNTRTASHFSDMNLWFNFWGDFVVTTFLSFLVCVVFESPMIIIEKAIFGNHGKKRTVEPANTA